MHLRHYFLLLVDHWRLLTRISIVYRSQHTLLKLNTLDQVVLLVTRLCGVNPGGFRANRLNRIKPEVCRTHMVIHFVEDWLPVVADLL